MKKNSKIIFVLLILAGLTFGFQSKYNTDPDPEKDKILLSLIRYALQKGHYEPRQIDDAFSEQVYKEFISAVDPTKRFFYQKDIDEFARYKHLIDDQIKNEDLTFFNLVYDRYNKRQKEARPYYKQILAEPFDYTKDETFSLDYDKLPYAKNESELIKRWYYQLKTNTISRLYDKERFQEAQRKNDPNYPLKSFAKLEKEAREGTEKGLDDFYDFMDDLTQDDWFSIFINSITLGFDPHTNYFAPKDKKRFDISMAGKLEGIGARLRKKDEYIEVVELISGGPAWRGGELEVGDAILKVAQGDGDPVDIIGMRIDDAIEFIKGKKGTEVKLTVLKLDGSIKVISIIRDIVELEETFVKSSLVEKNGKTYGLINLPKFYIDFKERNYRNSATDMEKEIQRMKEEHVDGILIDLRNNGGGSLKTAIEIAGLFIKNGPVVQVKYRGEEPIVKSDKNKKIAWDGPLVILVNELSASASEIFAAAMQDYKRAVIIGSKQTFGKGTVQNLLTLNDYYNYPKDLGALKMTIQKFYRINGGSTQLEGVKSDIAVPDKYTYLDIGERDEKNPLAWDKVTPAQYRPLDIYENFTETVNNSKERIFKSDQFKMIDEYAKWIKESREDQLVYLNYEKYKADLEKREARNKSYDAIKNFTSDLKFRSPKYEIPKMEADSILAKKRDIWHKNLQGDIYVEEALNVLSELKINKDKLLVRN